MIPIQLAALAVAIALAVGATGSWIVRGWKCDAAANALEAEASQAETKAHNEADAAAAQREQAKIIRQAALDGARKAIKEAKDACADTDIDPAIAGALGLPQQPAAP